MRVHSDTGENFTYEKFSERPNTLIADKTGRMEDYTINFNDCHISGEGNQKCCVGRHYGEELSLGHLYTISQSANEERTYDEPFTGDLPRARSWLCCPGSQKHVEGEQPPLFEDTKTPSTPREPITKEPSPYGFCNGACVGVNII